jgi:hypothetical protein
MPGDAAGIRTVRALDVTRSMESGGTGLLGCVLFSVSVCVLWRRKQKLAVHTSAEVSLVQTDNTLGSLIGNTPLVKLERLSKITGCDIFAKVCSLFV